MPTEDFFVRVPPDSTGKRVRNRADLVLPYTAGTRLAGIGFIEGEIVSGAVSGFRGIVYESTASTIGTVNILLTGSVETATSGELIQVGIGGSNLATASGIGIPFYSQAALIAGGNDLGNIAHVNTQGALKTEAAHGPQEDAFGRLRVSSPITLSENILRYDDLPLLFETILTGSATSTFDSNISGVILETGVDSGAKISRRSNRYHPYQAGISKLIQMTLIVSDAGKANVRRRWGYFDDDDGLFFELNGTALRVVQRSSTSGSPVDTVVEQANWNKDNTLGGGEESNPSGLALAVNNDNIYWIDFQWLGAGRSRFGMFAPTGEKVILHQFENANSETVPFMRTGTLPVSWEQENTAGAGSDSQLRVICTSIIEEGPFEPSHNHFGFTRENLVAVTAVGGSSIPLLSFRCSASHLGLPNRAIMIPTTLEIFGIAGTAPTAVVIEINRDAVLTSASFDQTVGVSNSMVALDTSAINSSAGITLLSALIAPTASGVTVKGIDLGDLFEFPGEVVTRNATIGSAANTTSYTVHARAIVGSADLSAALNWKEIL